MSTVIQPSLVLRPLSWGIAIALSVSIEGAIAPGWAQPQPSLVSSLALPSGNPTPIHHPDASLAEGTTAEDSLKTGKKRVKRPPGGRNKAQTGLDECPNRQPDLSLLVPEVKTEAGDLSVSGRSLSNRPKIWVYLPYLSTDGLTAELMLRDETGATVVGSNRPIQLSAQSEVVGVDLPEGFTLEAGVWYRWIFTVKCNPVRSVWGWVQYAPNAELARSIQSRPEAERAPLYRDQDYWLDAVTTLAEQRRRQPQNAALQQRWADLLNQNGLGEIQPQPLAQ